MVIRLFGNKIGEILGEDNSNVCGEETICCNFYPGILLDTGICFVQYIRKFLIGGAVISATSRAHSVKCDQVCRASELPIYMSKCEDQVVTSANSCVCPPQQGPVEGIFGGIRRSIWGIYDRFLQYHRDIEECMRQGQDMGSSMYKYLSEESDDTTRAGAIGVGALTGFILGIRGGLMRKLFFSGLGAYGMSAICYPDKTAAVTQEALAHSKKYAIIGYNFVNGVKKDDKQIPLPELPKLPKTMNEVWEMAGELGKSASSFISDTRTEPKPKVSKVHNPKVFIQESHSQASSSCDCGDDLYSNTKKHPS